MKCPKCQSDNPANTLYCGKCGTQLGPENFEPKPNQPSDDISVSHTKTLETPVSGLSIGSTFAGRYEVIEDLGHGGMGEVYKVLDKDLEEEVALKLLRPEIAMNQRTIERFRNEIKLARKITHKNVCRMHDLGKEGTTQFITMEYVAGEDLKNIIRRSGKLKTGQAVAIAMQICDGLIEAHRLGIIHRDLKPQNIMIDEEGTAKIMDFGIARTVEGRGVTAEGFIVGTPDYISPEQVDGKGVDQRADIYALGVILYEMVAGQVPFEGDTAFSVAMKHKGEDPLDPRKFNDQIPDNLTDLILRCMEKNRENRYQTSEELLNQLIAIEKFLPEKERIAPKIMPRLVPSKPKRFVLKKFLIPVSIVFAFVIIAILVWRVFLRQQALPVSERMPSLAILDFEDLSGDESLGYLRLGLRELFIGDLIQSKFIRVLRSDEINELLNELKIMDSPSYTLEDVKAISEAGPAEYILKGSFIQSGEKLRITAALIDGLTGQTISSWNKEGIEEDIFPIVDELTPEIKFSLDITPEEIADDFDEDIGTITTNSPQAYKHFVDGMRFFWKPGQYNNRKMIESMEKAISVDPDFAMAYRIASGRYHAMGNFAKSSEYMKKAQELKERLSFRERLLLECERLFFKMKTNRDLEEIVRAYEELLAVYSEDAMAYVSLGYVYYSVGLFEEALEQYEIIIQLKPNYKPAWWNKRASLMRLGRYEEALEVEKEYIKTLSPSAYTWDILISYGKYDLALEELNNRFPDEKQGIWKKGDIYLFQGKMEEAEKEYRKVLESWDDQKSWIERFRTMERLTDLYLLQGQFEKAREQAMEGIEHAENLRQPVWKSLFQFVIALLDYSMGNYEEALQEMQKLKRLDKFWEGLVYIAMKSISNADGIAETITNDLDIELLFNRKKMQYYHLMGRIELEKKNYPQAIGYLEKAYSLMPHQRFYERMGMENFHALYIDPLAFAYYLSGDLDKALEQYEKIISLNIGRLYHGDIYAKSFYQLGKIYEEVGLKSKAIENYEKFVELWKDSDPVFQHMVQDARERIETLSQ